MKKAATRRERGEAPGEVEAFFSGLIHDLRNLLDGVGMMLAEEPLQPHERSLEDAMFRNVYDVLRKTEDFRDRVFPAHVTEGAVEVKPIVEGALSRLGPFFRDREVSLRSEAGGEWAAVDRRALERIIENVLHVLAKRTDGEDAIRLSMRSDGEVRLTFEAPGHATPPVLDELFSAHHQGGLDLWVSRETARSYGGELESLANDGGIRLVLTLPMGEPPRGARRKAGTKQRVLVVDDDLDSARSLALLLSVAGFETEVCRDGPSALESAASFEPEAIVLDLGLPGIDGYEVCRRLRRGPGGKRLLVLAVSGRADDEALIAARDAGFDDHFLKPVDHGCLLQRLRD